MTMQQVGVRAVAEGTGRYVSDANQINEATARIGRTSETTARQSGRMAETLRATGARMREAGTQAVFLGSALAAPGILAARAASQLEQSFTEIETLVGIAADKVEEFKQGVFELSGETARSPQELASALFVVTSAGIRGSEALDVLAASAKASAVGLGDTSTIARTVTSSVQAFAEQNLTAGAATDILLATVREGNLVASDLAGSLSRVLGPAAQLGVQFADLGGFVATFTRLGGDSAEATTALRGIFATLIKPTSGAAAALDDVGLSIEGLRKQITEEGLAQTLVTLIDSFEGNDEALAQVIPNIRALTGVLNTAGVQSEEFVRIQGAIRDSLGATDKAFERTRQDVGFKFEQALNDLRIQFLQLGSDVLPFLGQLVGVIQKVVDAFTALPGPVKTGAFALLTLSGIGLIVVGTLGILAGSALSLIALFPALTAGAAAATAALAALGGVTGLIALAAPIAVAGAAVIGLGIIVKQTLDEASSEADSFSKDTREAMEGGAAAIFAQREEWIALRDAIEADIETFKAAGRDTADLEEQVAQLNIDIADLTAKLTIQSDALRDDANAMEAGRGAAADFQSAQASLGGQVDATTAALNEQIAALFAQRAAQGLAAQAGASVQQQISDEQAQTAGRGERAGFLGGGLGLLTPQEQEALRNSTQGFFEDRRKAAEAAVTAGGGGGGGGTSPVQATQERQIREQIESLLSGGEAGLQKTIRTQQQLDREFARFAETLRSRFGVEVPEIFRDMFDDIRKKALEAGQEVPNDLGNLLSFLVARRLGRGLPGGAGLISVPPAAAAAAGGGGGGQQITIEQINVGSGTTTGDIAQGIGTAARSTFGSQ